MNKEKYNAMSSLSAIDDLADLLETGIPIFASEREMMNVCTALAELVRPIAHKGVRRPRVAWVASAPLQHPVDPGLTLTSFAAAPRLSSVWCRRLGVLHDFVQHTNKLPKESDKWRGYYIGSWYARQCKMRNARELCLLQRAALEAVEDLVTFRN